jgi:hypothetical protein
LLYTSHPDRASCKQWGHYGWRYLPTSTLLGDFLGLSLSANNGTKASKQKLKTNALQSSLSMLLGELVGFLIPSMFTDYSPKLSACQPTLRPGTDCDFGISLRPLFVIFKSYQVTKHLCLFEHRVQMFHLGREQASKHVAHEWRR